MIVVILAGFLAASVGYFCAYEFDDFMAYWYATNAEKKAALGDREGALADCAKAIEWLPETPSLYEELAGIRAEVGDVEGALEYVDKLLELDPSRPWGYMHRAALYERLNEPEKAEQQRQQALRWLNDATAHVALNNRAYVLAQQDRLLDEALVDVQLALERVDPHKAPETYAMYVDTRAWVYYQQNRLELALVDARAAVEAVAAARRQEEATIRKEVEAARRRLEGLDDEAERKAGLEQLQAYAERERQKSRKELDRLEAVLLKHRSRIGEALGNLQQADADRRRADELGYDPKWDAPQPRY